MAEADVNAAINLQVAILNIPQIIDRGNTRPCCYLKELIKHCHPERRLQYENINAILNEKTLLSIMNNELEPLFEIDEFLMSGSVSDRTFMYSLNNETSSDVDIMFVLKRIKITEEDQKKGNLLVKESTPFVSLYLTDEDLIKTCGDCVETTTEATGERRSKLSSKKLKKRFHENLSISDNLVPHNKDNVQTVDDGPPLAVSTKGNILNWAIFMYLIMTWSLQSNAVDGHCALGNGYSDHDGGQVKISSRQSSKKIFILFAKVLPKVISDFLIPTPKLV